MTVKTFFLIGSAYGLLGVTAGAFGAHALKSKLAPELAHAFEVAVRYQMYHALALLAVAWAVTQFHDTFATAAGWFFVLGTLVFSGSLYALALSGIKLWGAVTPMGGLLLLAGWGSLMMAVVKGR